MLLHKFRHVEIATTLYDFVTVGETRRDVELENGIVWKLAVSRHRLQVEFFDNLDESFHSTLRGTAESVGALARRLGVRHLLSTGIELGRL